MLLAIGLQESRFEHRIQLVGNPPLPIGPAHGFWQFERGGGVRGVRDWIFKRPELAALATDALERLGYGPDVEDERYEAIVHIDILACLFARCLLYTLPSPLPKRGQHEEAWDQYLDAWRPGKPHRDTWNAFYDQAWEI